jgi:MoxR-like ATPase
VRALLARLDTLAEELTRSGRVPTGLALRPSSERVSWSERSDFRAEAWLSVCDERRSDDRDRPEARTWIDETGVYAGVYLPPDAQSNAGELATALGRGFRRYTPQARRPLEEVHGEALGQELLVARRWPPDLASRRGRAIIGPIATALTRAIDAVRHLEAAVEATGRPADVLADEPLRLPTPERFEEGLKRIAERLIVRRDIVEQLVANLVAGKYVILVGPTGCGKTALARLVSEVFFDIEPYTVTATADWTSYEVIGGIFPVVRETADGRQVQEFAVRRGCLYEAVLRNWETDQADGLPDGDRAPRRQVRAAGAGAVLGTWLVIDELNRADVDKAFGDLLMAAEYGELRVPAITPARPGEATRTVPIPKHFRIVATMSSFDRHYLFKLSDAVKRRFAFVEVGVPDDPVAERVKVVERVVEALRERELDADAEAVGQAAETLYDFLGMVRVFRAVGVAQAIAVLEYAAVRAALSGLRPEGYLEEALLAHVLPQLEGLASQHLACLRAWAAGDPATVLADLARDPGSFAARRDLRRVAGYLATRYQGPARERLERIAELLARPPAADSTTTLEGLLDGIGDLLAAQPPAGQLPLVVEALEGLMP